MAAPKPTRVFIPRKAAALTLEHAIAHVWRQAKLAQSCEENEDFEITLKLLGLLCDGSSGSALFNLACAYATGLTYAKYLRRRADRAEFMRLESLRCIPDYDASIETPMERDPTDGRRHFGNKFASHGLDTPAIQEAAARLGISRVTIYRRLRDGWDWERAISETRQPTHPRRFLPIAFIDSRRGSTKDLGKLPDIQIPNSHPQECRKSRSASARYRFSTESARKAAKASWVKRKQRLAESVAKKLLDSVSDYLYGEAQGARTAFERDSYTLALRVLAAVRQGDPDPFLCASYAAFGSSFPKHIQRRSKREDFSRAEFRDVASQRARASLPSTNTVVTQGMPRVEPNPISAEDGRQAAIGQPLGDRQTDYRRKLASVIPRPESPGVGDIAPC